MAVHLSGRHLGPKEPGKLPSDRGDDHVLGVLAGGQPTEAPAQPQLGGPGPGHHLGIQALLAAAQVDPDRGPVLVGSGRLDQLGAQVLVATLGDVAPPGRAAAGILRGHQATEATERGCPREPAPVAHLAGQRQRPELGDAPSANGARSYQPARSAWIASSWASRAFSTAR